MIKMLFLILTVGFCQTINAQTLDDSFGTNGKVVTELSNGVDGINEVLLQSDGKIIALGSANNRIQLARYYNDGSLDISFGVNGIVNTQIVSGFTFLNGGLKLLSQNDGKIILLGNGSANNIPQMRLMRFTSNGQTDTTFGNNGQVNLNSLFQFDSSCFVTNISQNINGGLQVIISSQQNSFAIIRFSANGVHDTTFGTNGINIIVTPQDSYGAFSRDSYTLHNGDQLVASWLTINGQFDFCLFKIKSNGYLDNSFGNNGFVTTDLGTFSDYSESVVVQPDGKILMGGTSNSKFALVRYTADGDLDTTFNGTGTSITTVGNSSFCSDMHLENDGKIILAGNIVNDFGCVKYNNNGTIDTSFGNNGKYVIDFGNSYDYGRAIIKQTDDKYIFAGMTSHLCSNRAFALTRFVVPSLNTLIADLNQTKIYPNPVSSFFELDSNEVITSISIYNSQGKKVKQFENQFIYDVSDLTSGIYIIILEAAEKKYYQKLLKK